MEEWSCKNKHIKVFIFLNFQMPKFGFFKAWMFEKSSKIIFIPLFVLWRYVYFQSISSYLVVFRKAFCMPFNSSSWAKCHRNLQSIRIGYFLCSNSCKKVNISFFIQNMCTIHSAFRARFSTQTVCLVDPSGTSSSIPSTQFKNVHISRRHKQPCL